MDSTATGILVAGGSVYADELGALDAPDVARAFSLSDGTVQWSKDNPPGSALSAVGNGLVYYAGGDGTILARAATTGVRCWSTSGTPLVLDGSRMFAATASTVVALTPAGDTQWSTPSSGDVISAAVQGGHLVVESFVATQNAPGALSSSAPTTRATVRCSAASASCRRTPTGPSTIPAASPSARGWST